MMLLSKGTKAGALAHVISRYSFLQLTNRPRPSPSHPVHFILWVNQPGNDIDCVQSNNNDSLQSTRMRYSESDNLHFPPIQGRYQYVSHFRVNKVTEIKKSVLVLISYLPRLSANKNIIIAAPFRCKAPMSSPGFRRKASFLSTMFSREVHDI